jgi:hypothetical protein
MDVDDSLASKCAWRLRVADNILRSVRLRARDRLKRVFAIYDLLETLREDVVLPASHAQKDFPQQ